MLTQNIFDQTPVWWLFSGTVVLLLIGSEIGYRLGKWRKAHMNEGEKAPANTMMGSALGLLAFILAFTFSMSSSRFDARKQLAQEEASSIFKAYQRAQFLPEQQRNECTRLLREYVALRVDIPKMQKVADIEAAVLKSERIQDALWNQAASMADRPNAVLAGFMASLSELTDLQTKRVRSVVWNRIPLTIVFSLYGIAFLGLATMGYSSSLAENRSMVPATVLILAFSAVIVLIVDMERPIQELFSVPQQPMTETARRMNAIQP